MWIEPNGVVKILKDVPLDNDYTHTISFGDGVNPADRTAQYNYFNSKVKYVYPKITYQRVKRNYMRVEINAENLYDCNYLMFQNSSFGDRWFYAFITKVEYVANMVSEIQYEIDVMQTWFWDCELRQSFVEREHSVHDYLYENFVDEYLELGPYENSEYHFPNNDGIPLLNEAVVVVGCTFANQQGTLDRPFEEWGVSNCSGLVSSLCYYIFNTTLYDEQGTDGLPGLLSLNHFIDEATRDNKADGIVTMYLMPRYFAQNTVQHAITNAKTLEYQEDVDLTHNGAYLVKNRKLLCYPYRMLHVTDFHGQEADYRYEMFGNTPYVSFRFVMGMTPEPSLIMLPKNYMGNSTNYNEFVVSKCYPNVGFSIDGFKAWLAQNWGSIITAEVGAIGGVLGSVSVPDVGSVAGSVGYSPTGALVESLNNIEATSPKGLVGSLGMAFGTMMQIWQHTTMPSYAKNNPTADAQWVAGLRTIGFCETHINYDYARRIDKYFDMFGYATRNVKIPNINSRPYWNYIKTGYVNIVGSIPADDLTAIQRIFMNGITFWKNGDNVGKYQLDNRPV